MQDGLRVIVPICLILSRNLFLILCLISGHQILVPQRHKSVVLSIKHSGNQATATEKKREAIKNKEDEW